MMNEKTIMLFPPLSVHRSVFRVHHFFSCLLLGCLLSACSPLYVLRAGYEEARILWYRRPIEEVLRRPDVDPTSREKLEVVLRVRRFAEQNLDFRVNGSYSSLTELANPPIVYVVTA